MLQIEAISLGDWKSRLHKPSLLPQTNEKSRVSEPALAGFVCVAAVSTAQLRMVQDLSITLVGTAHQSSY